MVDKQFVVEEGYGFEGDGGGGLWFFVAADSYSTDNDGTLVVPGGSYGDPATAGCWHRSGPGTQGNSILPSTTLDIRWFGALPNDADISAALGRAFDTLASVVGARQLGCLYAPAGEYRIAQKVVFDCGGNLGITIKGDGPGATSFLYGMSSSDTCMLEVRGSGPGSLQDFSVQYVNFGPTIINPSVIWINGCTYFSAVNIRGVDLQSNALTGGVLHCSSNTNLNLLNITLGGNGSDGTSLFWESGSGTVTGCNFLTSGTSAPCWRMPECNSIQIKNCFFQGGGPWKSFAGSTITSTGADFTVTAAAHGFLSGDYILLRGAANAGYNRWWRVNSAAANTLTVLSTAALGSDTATLSTLWSCGYLGAAGTNVTESFIGDCLFNTGGGPGSGSVGLYLDGFHGNNVGEIAVSGCLFDYGTCSIFCHGKTNSDPASSCHQISITNCRPNGGPRDDFGCFRIEGCTTVTIDGPRMFPGALSGPPGTGAILNAVVICDGGQAFYTEDIKITGGIYSNLNSSALYPACAEINGFVFDGANVRRVSVVNAGLDTSTAYCHPTKFVNGASIANGITVMYGDHLGNVVLECASGTHNL